MDLGLLIEPYRTKGGQNLQTNIISVFEERFTIVIKYQRPWLSHPCSTIERYYNK